MSTVAMKKNQAPARRPGAMRSAVAKARQKLDEAPRFPLQTPQLLPGVVPKGTKPAIAMDADFAGGMYNYASLAWGLSPEVIGFPGYPYLAFLATRPEYRAFMKPHARGRVWMSCACFERMSRRPLGKSILRCISAALIRNIDSYFDRVKRVVPR